MEPSASLASAVLYWLFASWFTDSPLQWQSVLGRSYWGRRILRSSDRLFDQGLFASGSRVLLYGEELYVHKNGGVVVVQCVPVSCQRHRGTVWNQRRPSHRQFGMARLHRAPRVLRSRDGLFVLVPIARGSSAPVTNYTSTGAALLRDSVMR